MYGGIWYFRESVQVEICYFKVSNNSMMVNPAGEIMCRCNCTVLMQIARNIYKI